MNSGIVYERWSHDLWLSAIISYEISVLLPFCYFEISEIQNCRMFSVFNGLNGFWMVWTCDIIIFVQPGLFSSDQKLFLYGDSPIVNKSFYFLHVVLCWKNFDCIVVRFLASFLMLNIHTIHDIFSSNLRFPKKILPHYNLTSTKMLDLEQRAFLFKK